MNILRSKVLALTLAMFGVAAVLGGTLGLATAAQRDLSQGFNLIGGPVSSNVEADDFVACLSATAWKAMYIWQADSQEWKHYFNPDKGVPAHVNNPSVGGILTVPRGDGVVIIMERAVSNAYFPDGPNYECPGS